ncbi:hypothetical protein Ciccas_009659, partial [Cichlidogyrus casuarinus]
MLKLKGKCILLNQLRYTNIPKALGPIDNVKFQEIEQDLLQKIVKYDANDHRLYEVQRRLVKQVQASIRTLYGLQPSVDKATISPEDRALLNEFFLKVSRFNETLFSYISSNLKIGEGVLPCFPSIYESLSKFHASLGNFSDYSNLMKWMSQDSVLKSPDIFIAGLETIGRSFTRQRMSRKQAEDLTNSLINDSFIDGINIFDHLYSYANQQDSIEKVRKSLDLTNYFVPVDRGLVTELAESSRPIFSTLLSEPFHGVNPFSNAFNSSQNLITAFKRQKAIELQGTVLIQPVVPSLSALDYWEPNKTNISKRRKDQLRASLLEEQKVWKKVLLHAFLDLLDRLKKTQRMRRMSPYSLLKILKPEQYVEIMVTMVDTIMADSSYQFASLNAVIRELGARCEHDCRIWELKQQGLIDVYESFYIRYAQQADSASIAQDSFRKLWFQACNEHSNEIAIIKERCRPWNQGLRFRVGRQLFQLMYDHLKFDENARRQSLLKNAPVEPRKEAPILYETERKIDNTCVQELKVHPKLAHWYSAADYPPLRFASVELPMLCPPVPRIDTGQAGYLFSSNYATDLIRQSTSERGSGQAIRDSVESIDSASFGEMYDALNCLSACPWQVNKEILSRVIELAQTSSDKNLSVIRPTEKPVSVNYKETRQLEETERKKVIREYFEKQKEYDESRSLWASSVYLLSIASKYKDETFYFPHSMDFRGRVYPCPPHFSYMGSDISRGILKFAKGVPLGEKGFDWLLIHLTNLSGLKKRASNTERLQFANSLMHEIEDSAENPFT